MKKTLQIVAIIILIPAIGVVYGKLLFDIANKKAAEDINFEDILSEEDFVHYEPVYEKSEPTKPFGFGLEYVFQKDAIDQEGKSEVFGGTGANWIKFAELTWEQIEPRQPRDGVHTYDFSGMDKRVGEWHRAGVENIWIVLKAQSKWGTTNNLKLEPWFLFGAQAGSVPKDEHKDDYRDYVQALVERYDGDGVDDMPGLEHPVVYYEIESEAQHGVYWTGTVDDYLETLRLSHEGAKAANQDTHIVLSGVNFSDVFDDNPDYATLLERLDTVDPPLVKRSVYDALQFTFKTFAATDIYDDIEFHALYSPEGIYPTVAVMRNYLKQRGIDKPIWAGDATSNIRLERDPVENYNLRIDLKEGQQILKKLKDDAKQFPDIRDWHQEQQAAYMFKKYIISMDLNLEGIMMCCLEDWPIVGYSNNFSYGGILDSDNTPRAAYYALDLLLDEFKDYDSIERFHLAEDVYTYILEVDGKTKYVLWYEPNENFTPTRSESATIVDLSIPGDNATITSVVSLDGKFSSESRSAVDGILEDLEIGEFPIIIEVLQ